MTRFFVSATGNDANTGTSGLRPWKTITRVNTACANGAVVQGDTLSFQRGGTYYGKIIPPATLAAGSAGWLRLDAYGDGTAPIISGYKVLTSGTAWTQYDANTWQIDLSSANAGTGYFGYDNVQGGGADVGFIKVDGVIYGRRVFDLALLSNQWDFYCATNTLYVRSTARPTTLATDIRVPVDGPQILARSALWVEGLKITGGGGHGIRDASGGGASRVRVFDNELCELGGSALEAFQDGTTRYGNGVEVWITSSDWIIERNRIHDVYDVAFTSQGGSGTDPGGWTNITFRRNLTYRNSQSVEFWSDGASTTGGFSNVVVELNTCLFAGYGWGGDYRPNPNNRVHLLNYQWNLPADIKVRNNVFYDGRAAYQYQQVPATGLVASGNMILQRPNGLLRYTQSETIEQGSAWAAREYVEAGSRFVALPSSATTTIADSDITAAISYLDGLKLGGQVVGVGAGTLKTLPIHAPWR